MELVGWEHRPVNFTKKDLPMFLKVKSFITSLKKNLVYYFFVKKNEQIIFIAYIYLSLSYYKKKKEKWEHNS